MCVTEAETGLGTPCDCEMLKGAAESSAESLRPQSAFGLEIGDLIEKPSN